MDLPVGIGPNSLPEPYQNLSRIGVADALKRVVTTTSVSSMPLADLMVSPVEFPSNPQSPPPQHLLYSVYPPSKLSH